MKSQRQHDAGAEQVAIVRLHPPEKKPVSDRCHPHGIPPALPQRDTAPPGRNAERLRAKGWPEVVPGADARTQPFRPDRPGEEAAGAGGPGLGTSPTTGGRSWVTKASPCPAKRPA